MTKVDPRTVRVKMLTNPCPAGVFHLFAAYIANVTRYFLIFEIISPNLLFLSRHQKQM